MAPPHCSAKGLLRPSVAVQAAISADLPDALPDNVLELLQPGAFVRLRNQPTDLPPFQVIHCRGGRCWVRQQAWGPQVHWEVEHRSLTTAV